MNLFFRSSTSGSKCSAKRDETLLESLLREHGPTTIEIAEQRRELRGWIFGLGVFSRQHVLSGGWRKEH
jgi:hypothetical protein